MIEGLAPSGRNVIQKAVDFVLGPFDWPQVTQAGARGAALLAGIAAGRYGGIDELPRSARATPERSLR